MLYIIDCDLEIYIISHNAWLIKKLTLITISYDVFTMHWVMSKALMLLFGFSFFKKKKNYM